jgi:hypothetical protein
MKDLLLKIISFPFMLITALLWSKKEGEGSDPRYEAWLNKYGYEAQYQAYRKAHNGSNAGFVYSDPGDMPKDWQP